MSEKLMDDLLYKAGEKMEMDSLGEPCAYHHFSEDYEKRKKQMRERVQKAEVRQKAPSTDRSGKTRKHFSMRRWSVFAAAAVLVCAFSLIAYAYFRNLEMDISQSNNTVSVQIKEKIDTAADPEQSVDGQENSAGHFANNIESQLQELPKDGIEIPRVEISLSYIPDGYEHIEGMSAGHFSVGGKYAGDGFWVTQNTSRSMRISFTKDFETKKIGQMDAIITHPEKTDTDATYYAYVYLLNPEDMVCIALGSDTPDITSDELVRIAEGLTYKPTSETIVAYKDSIEYSDTNEDDLLFSKSQLTTEFQINGTDAYGKTPFEATIKITGVQFKDDIQGLDRNNFYKRDTLDNYLTDDGAFKDERIPFIDEENGQTALKENADQKLMLITYEITNTGNYDITKYSLNSIRTYAFEDAGEDYLKYQPRPYYYDEIGDGYCYLDHSDYDQNSEDRVHSFFCIDIPQGESRTVTIGKTVYADEIEQLYLCYSPNTGVAFSKEENKLFKLIALKDFMK